MRNISFADNVPANHTIWILGDSVLTDAASQYNYFKKKKDSSEASADWNQQNHLYMENMYAIRIVSPGVYTARQAKNTPNIVLNDFVDTLNIKAKVPHTLVILMNDYRFWNDANLLTHQMERILSRFLKEIRRIAEDRNNSLPPRAVNWGYPRVFITKALPLPNNMAKPYPKNFKANRHNFNKLLQRGQALDNYTVINLPEFTSENENQLFTKEGGITKKGYRSLWIAVSDAIHRADNLDRINRNKAKAKQLSAQISLTTEELNDGNISDVESLDSMPVTCSSFKPAKRALLHEFNSANQEQSPYQQKSPASAISEYYTRPNKTAPDRQHVHHINNRKQQNQHFPGKGKRHCKNNWRNPNNQY